MDKIRPVAVFVALGIALLSMLWWERQSVQAVPWPPEDQYAEASQRADDVATQVAASEPVWDIQCVDCPKSFGRGSPRSLLLDTNGYPHIAYGGAHLYYAYYDGATWHLETVDDTPGVGESASLALDGAGYAHIGYYDSINADLKYAYWTGSTWVSTTVDSASTVGEYLSLALDAAGYAHISYYDATHESLKYAHWTGTAWQTETVDWIVGSAYNSLALDDAGAPHISYYSRLNLCYASWTGSEWVIEIVDAKQFTGDYSSLALDNAGRPHIIYLNGGDQLLYAHWNGSTWISETVDAWSLCSFGSLALDETGRPHVSYTGGFSPESVQYAYKTSSGGWFIETVAADVGILGSTSSLVMDETGHPHISYFDYVNYDLIYTHWTGSVWAATTIDSAGIVGMSSSLALDEAEYPHIGYYDRANTALKYTHWTGAAWVSEATIENAIVASMVLDEMGLARVSYLDTANADLKYARWTGYVWISETVDSIGNVCSKASLKLDHAGYPHIAYYNAINDTLKYAYWTGSVWSIETVDDVGNLCGDVSLALDEAAQPHISYFDSINDTLRYARKLDDNWLTETVDSAGLYVGDDSSLVVDSTGRPHISYISASAWNYSVLKYARRAGNAWDIETVDHPEGEGGFGTPALALDGAGRPHIAYQDDYDDDLKYAYWTGTRWVSETVESVGRLGFDTSLALDTAGHPYISYYDMTNTGLKYAVRTTDPLVEGLTIAPESTEVTFLILETDASGYTTTIAFPLGAVTQTTTFVHTIYSTMASSPDGYGFAGHAFGLAAYQSGQLQTTFHFAHPITITMCYSDASVIDLNEDTLALFGYDEGVWHSDGLTVTQRLTASNRLIVQSNHLTDFALFGQPDVSTSLIYLPVVLR